jgi:hypothetical protein
LCHGDHREGAAECCREFEGVPQFFFFDSPKNGGSKGVDQGWGDALGMPSPTFGERRLAGHLLVGWAEVLQAAISAKLVLPTDGLPVLDQQRMVLVE